MHYIMIDKWLPLLPESVQSFDRAMLESKCRYKHHNNNNNWSRYSSGNRNKLNLIKNSGEGIINRIDEVVQPQPRKELVWRNPPPFGASALLLEDTWNPHGTKHQTTLNSKLPAHHPCASPSSEDRLCPDFVSFSMCSIIRCSSGEERLLTPPSSYWSRRLVHVDTDPRDPPARYDSDLQKTSTSSLQ